MTERQRARFESETLRDLIRRVPYEKLPDSHRMFADVIGLEAALKLCEVIGGREIYIPEYPSSGDFGNAHSCFLEVIGQGATLKLCRTFGCERIYLPNNSKLKYYLEKLDIHEAYYGKGMKVPEIAMDFGTTDRTVQRIIGMRLDEITV